MADVGVLAAAPASSPASSSHTHPSSTSSRLPSSSTHSSAAESYTDGDRSTLRAGARDSPIPRRSPDDRVSIHSLRIQSRADSRASQSTTFPAFTSSLDYTAVRDFAYAADDPYHYGIPTAIPSSGATTPASEFYGGRRLSDPAEALRSGARFFSAGQWGGDGVIFDDPSSDVAPLPSTSFGDSDAAYAYSSGPVGGMNDDADGRKSKHRKSKSYADISDFDRGWRKDHRRSKDVDFNRFSGSAGASNPYDPAGREGLRLSRGFAVDSTGSRRDSHFARSLQTNGHNHFLHPGTADPDTRMPLDDEELSLLSGAEAAAAATAPPQRASMGPEDESVRGQALALYDFTPENPNELRLREGQTVMVAYRNGHGWLVAEDPATREQGLVPEEYVRLVRDIEGWDEVRGEFFGDTEELTEGGEESGGVEIEEDETEEFTGDVTGSSTAEDASMGHSATKSTNAVS